MAERDRYGELFTALAGVLQEFGRSLDSTSEPEPADDRPPAPADEHALGRRQQQIVDALAKATEAGLKTAAVAAAVDYEVPNTYTALQSLARSQVVEQVPGKEPQHWRLARRYRPNARTFARAADAIAAGEWATAADVSIAVRGDIRAAESVEQAGLSHRILAEGTPAGDVRERLESEGVTFLEDGRADPRQRLNWDELARRCEVSQTRRRVMTKGTLNYIEIPAVDLDLSSTFYAEVFGWQVTRRPTVSEALEQTSYPTFVDATGRVGGAFVLGRQPSREPGIMPHIKVESIAETLAAIVDHGGEVTTPRTPIVEGTDWEAAFRDPAGNTLGLFETNAE